MSDVPQVLDYSNLFLSESQQRTDNLLDDFIPPPSFVSLLQKEVEKQLPFVVVPMFRSFVKESFWSSLEPMLDNSMRKIVKEQLDRALEKFSAKANWDEPGTSEPRHLTLKFQDRVRVPVYTGKEIKGDKDNSIRLALVDADGNLINSGSEASSKVEIMVRLDGVDDSESSGEFGSCTKLTEKKQRRPLLSKRCVKLKEGIADLDNMKFKNRAKWTKRSQVRLVARFMGNIEGTTVKDAVTEAFLVTDRRGALYKKRHPPLLTDALWRLKGIRREGKLHKLLQKEKINSVEEFLRAQNLNPQKLQEVIERLDINAEKFKAMVEHAKECEIPRDLYKYDPRSGENAAVVFDYVGCVRGLRHNDRGFVPVDNLNEDDKVAAQKMVMTAFQHCLQLYDNEASTSDFLAQMPNDANNSISPGLASPSGFIMGPIETNDGIDFAALMSPFYERHYDVNGYCQIDIDSVCPGINYFDNFELFNHDAILQSANPRIESHNNQHTSAAVCKGSCAHIDSSGEAKKRWKMVVMSLRKSFFSVRKRIVVPEDTHAQKKQRHR